MKKMSILHDLSILFVTSPSPSHPSTYLIETAIDSLFRNLGEIPKTVPLLIAYDGYELTTGDPRTKKGKVTGELAQRYTTYIENTREMCQNRGFNAIHLVSEKHRGFAFSVKLGLEACSTKYCLICQHDRTFLAPFHGMNYLLQAMEERSHIRYIGFPTSTNRTHNIVLNTRYHLTSLLQEDMLIRFPLTSSSLSPSSLTDDSDPSLSSSISNSTPSFYLQPLIFWFDSQHLAHVQRYLQIYSPFHASPPFPAHLFPPSTPTMILNNKSKKETKENLVIEENEFEGGGDGGDRVEGWEGDDDNEEEVQLREEQTEGKLPSSLSNPPSPPLPLPLFSPFITRLLSEMILKRGDFIEDKFGQVQRNLLIQMRRNKEKEKEIEGERDQGMNGERDNEREEEEKEVIETEVEKQTGIEEHNHNNNNTNNNNNNNNHKDIDDVFHWFGSYLVWEVDKTQPSSSSSFPTTNTTSTISSSSLISTSSHSSSFSFDSSSTSSTSSTSSSSPLSSSSLTFFSSRVLYPSKIFVGHLKGRIFDTEKIERYKSGPSIKSKEKRINNNNNKKLS